MIGLSEDKKKTCDALMYEGKVVKYVNRDIYEGWS